MQFSFCPILLLLLSIPSSYSSPALCSPGRLFVQGNDIIESSRGLLLLVVYMPLQCSNCHRQLREFEAMAQSITELRIVVVAPGFEAPSLVSRIQQEFSILTVDRDEAGQLTAAGVRQHDQTLYDRCGRVASSLSSVRGEVVGYRDTVDAVRSSLQQAKCGWCQYDSRGGRDLSRVDRNPAKNVNAYLKPGSPEARRADAERQRTHYSYQPTQPQTFPQPTSPPSYNHRQDERYPQRQQQAQYEPRPTPAYRQEYTQQRQDYHQQRQENNQQRIDYNQQNYNSRPAQQQNQHNQQQQQHQQQQQYQYDNANRQYQPEPSAPVLHIPPTMPSPTLPASTKKSIYAPDDDYDDYGEPKNHKPVVFTTQAPETQIPSPTAWNPFWPTPPPQNPQFLGMRQYQVNQPFGPVVSENNIPCTAYTDDICFQQQEKLGRTGLSKCCSKGIYFTDLCVPGKCSNSTAQLCCFQKFLQAKYSCCEDSTQSDNTSSTNKFSKCCYENFVQEDECCTEESAAQYWSSIHEICYPNTKVDYSNVKMEVRFAEGVRVVDLGTNRLWDYECRFGGNRIQYAYIP